ncbi:unnamed protein product [Phytophthora fragariaefolia]|uniref:Unnamed protein product n=1 Tax=Phytophthora fragariaefolia TaxID=1490495 RepID=A0A9W6XGH8_9STRA|nr:unnamed protein product [Phytophthora fragariaefolia]
MALEASEAAPSTTAASSPSISRGIGASVPKVTPLGATGVLGRNAVEVVGDAGDVGARGIGENGGLEPLG